MKNVFVMILVPVLALFIASCNSSSENQSTDKEHTEMHEDHSGHNHEHTTEGKGDKSGPEYTSDYVCPMHCEGSGSDKPGKCPVCGMAYKKNEG